MMSDDYEPARHLAERDTETGPPSGLLPPLPIDIETVAALIAGDQYDSGEIPWRRGEKTDPWDHVEAAMGLTIGGYHAHARRAFDWLAGMQLPDGSWYAGYRRGRPVDRTRDSNLCAYVAVGVYHHFLVTGDSEFVHRLWPTVAAAIKFALSLQAPEGHVFWAVSPQGQVDHMALLTGCSSIHMSLKCALALARILNRPQPGWQLAMERLAATVRCRPHLFDPTKARFSMDWFYPVLAGIITGPAARRRIEAQWDKFVINGHGVRCVSDQPWITLAETSELTLTLVAIGEMDRAREVFGWICGKRYADGSYWCGFTCPDMTIWPEDKMTWTNAVVLLAADALWDLTPAGSLFKHRFWLDT